MRGSMDPKKAIRLTLGRSIARTRQRKTSGSPRRRGEQFGITAPSHPKFARLRQQPSTAVGIRGGLEVR
jgi:hypothetical protein